MGGRRRGRVSSGGGGGGGVWARAFGHGQAGSGGGVERKGSAPQDWDEDSGTATLGAPILTERHRLKHTAPCFVTLDAHHATAGTDVNIALDEPLHLLHTQRFGTLATRSRDDGCPYPSVLPFAPDALHRPVMLVSRLAEHTRNLLADAQAGFLLFDAQSVDVLSGARTTVTGRVVPSESAENGPEGSVRGGPRVKPVSPARRYLRYHPAAERYLALGDFSFFTLVPHRLRHIGGFGAMGWIDADQLNMIVPLDEAEETTYLDNASRTLPDIIRLLGIDRLGIDYEIAGIRHRFLIANSASNVTSGTNTAARDIPFDRAVDSAINTIVQGLPATR
jgi:heme iron utilization protein